MDHLSWVSAMNGEWADASITRRTRLWVVGGLALVVTVAILTRPPIPQIQSYNDFIDQRAMLGVPNLLNTLSNVPFLLVGVLGLFFVWRNQASDGGGAFVERSEKWPYVLFFLGTALTCFGSAYYHLAPSDDRLVWDRLPMTLVFMSFFAATIAERINVRAGVWLLLPLVVVGIGSVVYWHLSELRVTGGDLRWYVEVQYYPMLAIPIIAFLFPSRYTRGTYVFGVLVLYAVAKAFELLDARAFTLGQVVSGHTLKHLTAALALYYVLWTLQRRHPLAPGLHSVSDSQTGGKNDGYSLEC
jgi:hypothetical protein